jgi:hypothetical protein
MRVLYRLRVIRLPECYQEWVLDDIGSPGARSRFAGTGLAAVGTMSAFYVLVLGMPLGSGVWLGCFFLGCAFTMTRPSAWKRIEESILRSNGVLTPAQLEGARQGPGKWIDGRWYCDNHGRSFCGHCAPRTR